MRYLLICLTFLSFALTTTACAPSQEQGTAPPPKAGNPDPGETPDEGAGEGEGDGEMRSLAVTEDAQLYSRVEGTNVNNACTTDADCMTSGCSKEVCAAEEVMTDCSVLEWPQGEASVCGCVENTCAWYK
ncbi:eight-cysteine-cluster domain-containing protein [Haliangium ochraceum]|uniref:Lipoprotein n=1 Tax=Haliangium ochraceum (strain DSM 14365 / JCM 11303 / SMP-2) TaxID=502025 RepID=D0LYZ8_HALO1|nr:eight-cysteine-cluster domain-containing protein [Haliangium ochraceum]ACY14468.1 hypothetical protein Hoch_1921 [Haliangium ochraceum DSM 14365]